MLLDSAFMRHILGLLCLLVASAAELDVVATIPDLADIVEEIGGNRVEVQSIAKGTENDHAVSVRPSAIVAANRADLFVQMGLSLEHAYVPGLLSTARNKDIRPGAEGFLDVSTGWEPIQVPASLDRSQGTDLHPAGNPHFNLDPRGGRHIADCVLQKLIELDPDGRATYEARHADYVRRLDAARAHWDEIGKTWLRGLKVVEYHASFDYLTAYHGMEVVGTLEPKPGIAPTPKHLATMIRTMQEKGVRIILTASWSNNRDVAEVAKQTGALVVEIPTMVHGAKGTDTWIDKMNLIHERIAEAAEATKEH